MLWVLKRTVNDGSFEHPKHMFKLMVKKIIVILCKLFLLNWSFVLECPFKGFQFARGSYISAHVLLNLLNKLRKR